MLNMTPLCELARKYGTDKGGDHLQRGDTCHTYTPAYWFMFRRRRHQVKAVLEIGIGGGHSLRMWKEYFPNATIYGIDSNPECLAQAEDRIRCFQADQYNEAELNRVLDQIKSTLFDLIVDDGSHEPAHQIFTAQVLLPYLANDGVYVIEDIEPDCQPQLIGNPIVQNMPTKEWTWNPLPTGRGIGRAYCRCGCETGEQLVVLRHV
jgi:SAM-dependent methyltransferase